MIGKSYQESVIQGKSYRLLRARVRHVLLEYGVTPTEWSVIGFLLSKKELYQIEIGEYLAVEAPLVTNIISAMEKKGLLTKESSQVDARRKVVVLTASAKKSIPIIEKRVQAEMKNIFGELGEGKIAIYFEVLEHIIKKLEK